MIARSILDCIGETPLLQLDRLFPQPGASVYAKLEFLNPGGSIKDRPARFVIEEGLRQGKIDKNTRIVESSSGNFGIALAMVCKMHNLPFTCVVDPKTVPANLQMLELYGAKVEMVHEPDEHGGYLKTRIRHVESILARDPHAYWINQYANPLNWQAHYEGAGAEIARDMQKQPPDILVVPVSTTGSIMGMARRLRRSFPDLQVVAVDAVGSVIFGAPASCRELPGIGASRVPEMLEATLVDQVIYVNDEQALQGCRKLLDAEGVFAGGSSGAVITAIEGIRKRLSGEQRIVTVLPDRGERYLDFFKPGVDLSPRVRAAGLLSPEIHRTIHVG